MTRRAAPEELDDGPGPLFSAEMQRALDARLKAKHRAPDLPTALATIRRDEGMAKVMAPSDAATEQWDRDFLDAVERHARTHETFLVEDVIERCKPVDGVNTKRAGPLMKRAQAHGYCEPGGYAKARTSNLSVKVLWRSKLWRGGEA